MASVEQNRVDIELLRIELEQLKSSGKKANELDDTITPAHIIVHEGNDYKKVIGIPVVVESTADLYIIKHPDGTVLMEISKD